VAAREASHKPGNQGAMQAEASDVRTRRRREKKRRRIKREFTKLKTKAPPRWPGFPLGSRVRLGVQSSLWRDRVNSLAAWSTDWSMLPYSSRLSLQPCYIQRDFPILSQSPATRPRVLLSHWVLIGYQKDPLLSIPTHSKSTPISIRASLFMYGP